MWDNLLVTYAVNTTSKYVMVNYFDRRSTIEEIFQDPRVRVLSPGDL